MRDKYAQILKALASTKVSLFVLAFLMFIGAITVASARFKLLIDAQEIPVTFRRRCR